MELKAQVLVGGEASGPVLKLDKAICFWGGVDLSDGRISDPHHPQSGVLLVDRIVAIPAIVGSSSSSQYLLELMRTGRAPAAVLLGQPDAILAMASIVGREMNYRSVPVLHCDLDLLVDNQDVQISEDGTVSAF